MGKSKEYLLFDNIKNSDVKKVEMVISSLKPNINCVEEETGITPLLHSIYQGNPQIVKILIDNKADVNQSGKVDNVALTPLMRTVYQ